MATLLEDMVSYLIAQGLVVGDGIDIFRDYSPDTPDSVVILHEYAGNPTQKGIQVDIRNVQVTVRAATATAAKTLCSLLYNVLNPQEESITDLTATRWAIVNAKQPPFKIAVDLAKRVIYGFNMSIVTYRD